MAYPGYGYGNAPVSMAELHVRWYRLVVDLEFFRRGHLFLSFPFLSFSIFFPFFPFANPSLFGMA